MRRARAYSGRQFVAAVCLSAFLGWIYFAWPSILNAPLMLPVAMIATLPVALAICCVFVAPFLWLLMARPVGWRRAARSGFYISAIMALAGFVFARYQGRLAANNPSFSFQNGGGAYVQEIDGVLTPYGWLMSAWGAALFILAGVVASLIVRAIIGPGRISTDVPEVELAATDRHADR